MTGQLLRTLAVGSNGSVVNAAMPSTICTTQVNLMCYVDGPLAAIRGTKSDRLLHASTLMLVWEALGFGLAYPKGQLEDDVTWIGGTINVEADGVRVKVKESIVSVICDDLRRIMGGNVITLKVLHALIGKRGQVMRPAYSSSCDLSWDHCGLRYTTRPTPRHPPTRCGRSRSS